MHERKLMARFDICSICLVANSFSKSSRWCSRQRKTWVLFLLPSPQNNDKRLKDVVKDATVTVASFTTFCFLNKWRQNNLCRPITCCLGSSFITISMHKAAEKVRTHLHIHYLLSLDRNWLGYRPAHVSTQTRRVPEEFLQTGVTEPMSTGRHLDRLPHRLAAERTLEAPLRLLQELVVEPGHGCTVRRCTTDDSAG